MKLYFTDLLHRFWRRASDIICLQMFSLTVSHYRLPLTLLLPSFSLAVCNSFLSVSFLFSPLLLLLLIPLLPPTPFLLLPSQLLCSKINRYGFHILVSGFQNSPSVLLRCFASVVKEKDRETFSLGQFRGNKW